MTSSAKPARPRRRSDKPSRENGVLPQPLGDRVFPHRHVADQPDRVAVLRDARHAAPDQRARTSQHDRCPTDRTSRPSSGARMPLTQLGQRRLAVAGDAGDADDLAAAHASRASVAAARRAAPHGDAGQTQHAAPPVPAADARQAFSARPTISSASSLRSVSAVRALGHQLAAAQHGDAVADTPSPRRACG